MTTKPSKAPHNRPLSPAPRPQLAVRSSLRAGISGDCSLGVSYWRKELNNLKQLADVLDCR